MINSDNCGEACLLCESNQDVKINYSAVHGLCHEHMVSKGEIVECFRCKAEVRIMDYFPTPKMEEAIEAANSAIVRDDYEDSAEKLVDLFQNSQGFHVSVDFLCCECKQEEMSIKICEKHGYCETCIQRTSLSKECPICSDSDSVSVCQCGFKGKDLNSVCGMTLCDTCLAVMIETRHILQCRRCGVFRNNKDKKCKFCPKAKPKNTNPAKVAKDMYRAGMVIFNYLK